jgi:phospholipid N-methyltransferase
MFQPIINKIPSIKNQLNYIRTFIASPRTMGTLFPSSSRLCHTMISQVDWSRPLKISELGAAHGVLTRRILCRMRTDAELEAFEIQPTFVEKLTAIDDDRLSVLNYSAEYMNTDYDVVFSCLPFTSLPIRTSARILYKTRTKLKEKNGVLVMFQYSTISEKMLSRHFTWKRKLVINNIPPAFVYTCRPK